MVLKNIDKQLKLLKKVYEEDAPGTTMMMFVMSVLAIIWLSAIAFGVAWVVHMIGVAIW